jgi:hypothetical protein
MKKRKLPIGGIQTFSELRRDYDVYVDKTQHIYDLASRYKTVFLSRPRRFGKSLLCSTIKSVFKGEKELFDGLAISKTDWQWQEHPIIHLDLSLEDFTKSNGVETLIKSVNRQLSNICDNYGIFVEESNFIGDRFAQVIAELSKKSNRVVVIIDEYDNPLLSTITQKELNDELRCTLKGFYSVLKGSDQYLRFVFITGITKFAQITMFSGMNQPKDISMALEHCDICGITQEELEENFAPEINEYSKKYGGRENYLKELKDFYNGYFFTKEKTSVYNPYGILNHFDCNAEFTPYWSLSGAPSFALKYLEEKGVNILDIEDARMDAGGFANYKDDTISIFPLLYQAGYLTISDYDERTGFYRLNYPNIEVRKTFAEFLANNYSQAKSILAKSISIEFVDALVDGNVDEFMNLLKWYLHTVDYSLSSKITESYVEFAVSNIINMLGLVCVNEAHTANGSMDSVIFTKDRIYIFEFKVDKPVENALRQIKRKDYALFYARDGRKIVKVGVVFSRESRNIVEWKTED